MNYGVEFIRRHQHKSITPHALEAIHPRFEHVPNFYQRILPDPEDYRSEGPPNESDESWLKKTQEANQKATLRAEFIDKFSTPTNSDQYPHQQQGNNSTRNGGKKVKLPDPVAIAAAQAQQEYEIAFLDEANRKRLGADPRVREIRSILAVLEQRRNMELCTNRKALEHKQEEMVTALDQMQDAADDADWFKRASNAECIRREAGRETRQFVKEEIAAQARQKKCARQLELDRERLQLERLRVQNLIDEQRRIEELRKQTAHALQEQKQMAALRAQELAERRRAEEAEDERIRNYHATLFDREAAVKERRRARAEQTRVCYERAQAVADKENAYKTEYEQLQQELVHYEQIQQEECRAQKVQQKKVQVKQQCRDFIQQHQREKSERQLEEQQLEMHYMQEMIAQNDLQDARAAKLGADRAAAQAATLAQQHRNEQLRQTQHHDEQRREKELENNLKAYHDTLDRDVAQERQRLLAEAVDNYGLKMVSCVKAHLQQSEQEFLEQQQPHQCTSVK